MELTHLNPQNNPQMVDISNKQITNRSATASGIISMSKEAFDAIINNQVKKGPVLQTAIIAAIMGAKKCSDLIPMCHPLNISSVDIKIEELVVQKAFRLYATVSLEAKTGAEMEALMAVNIGLLTIYDMVKAIDKSMKIGDIKLVKKSGGKSGDFDINEKKRLIMGFCGPSNSGKTTLIKKMIEILSPTYKVAAIKHDAEDKAIVDKDGKDSKIFFDTGADVALFSNYRTTIFRHCGGNFKEMIEALGDFDYLFIEGLKELPIPKIGIFRNNIDESFLPHCLAIAVDESVINLPKDKEVLDLNNPKEIIDWIDKNGARG